MTVRWSEEGGGGAAGRLGVHQRGGRPEHRRSPLVPDHLHQAAGLLLLVSHQTEVSEPLLLLPPPLPGYPRPPLLKLVVSQLLGVVPRQPPLDPTVSGFILTSQSWRR